MTTEPITTEPVTSEPVTTEPPPNSDGPPEPSTPNIIGGHCDEVIADTTKTVESASATEREQTEAHAYRALANLCLHQDATNDLAFARDNKDELTAETRALLDDVVAAHLPEGDELRKLLRERTG